MGTVPCQYFDAWESNISKRSQLLSSTLQLSSELFNRDLEFLTPLLYTSRVFWKIVLETLSLKYSTYKLSKNYNELTKLLRTCSGPNTSSKCESCSFKIKLPVVAENAVACNIKQRDLINTLRMKKMPSFLLKLHEDILWDLEDIAENNLIIADDEIRQLVKKISEKNK